MACPLNTASLQQVLTREEADNRKDFTYQLEMKLEKEGDDVATVVIDAGKMVRNN